jgi:hypothetical protein
MAYTAVPTITTGDVATAAWGNTYIKNNFAAGVPDIFTTDGDMAVGTGANAAERVAVMDSSNLVKRDRGGLEVALADPDADRILFWDDSAGAYAYLTSGTNLSISATTLNATGGTEATESDMKDEGAANADRYVSPEVAKFAPGASKAYGFFNAPGTLAAGSHNVTGVAKNSTGNYTITWATDFANSVYTVTEALNGTPGFYVAHTPATGTIVVESKDTAASASDIGHYFAAYGVQ